MKMRDWKSEYFEAMVLLHDIDRQFGNMIVVAVRICNGEQVGEKSTLRKMIGLDKWIEDKNKS